MALEKVLAEFDPALRQPDVAAVAKHDSKTDLPTNPIADVVTKYRARRSECYQNPNVQLLRFPGVQRCCNKRCLTRNGDAHALKTNGERHSPVAIFLKTAHTSCVNHRS